MRPFWPLALMSSAEQVPTKSTRSFLAWHLTGFPDRRSRPFRINVVITPAVHERTDATLSSQWSDRREPRHTVGLTFGQQSPSDARHFIGQRDRDDLERTSCQQLCEPRIFLRMQAGTLQDRMRTDH